MSVDYSAAALAAARRYCGWVVTPSDTEDVTVDGPGGHTLSLPTLYLTDLVSVTEDGVALDVASLYYSSSGVVAKRSGGHWSNKPGAITVTMTHGYGTAPDFDAAVEHGALALAAAANRPDPSMKRKRVDDTEYEWYETAKSFLNTSLLDGYRILPSP